MNDINGYTYNDLQDQIFSKLPQFTKGEIDRKLESFRTALAQYPHDGEPIPVSIGENCGPGVKIRETGRKPLGSLFFDNLVCPLPSIIRIFDNDFRGLLQLENLHISTWETHDSVYDESYGLFFHHYFHLRPVRLEKSHIDANGKRRRRIDEADIPLFLPLVAAQFGYLTQKMRILMRSHAPKHLYLRKVSGEFVPSIMLKSLGQTLNRWGAVNTDISIVCSTLPSPGEELPPRHYLVQEVGERWGATDQWQALFSRQSDIPKLCP